jgi:hypothetical protein
MLALMQFINQLTVFQSQSAPGKLSSAAGYVLVWINRSYSRIQAVQASNCPIRDFKLAKEVALITFYFSSASLETVASLLQKWLIRYWLAV